MQNSFLYYVYGIRGMKCTRSEYKGNAIIYMLNTVRRERSRCLGGLLPERGTARNLAARQQGQGQDCTTRLGEASWGKQGETARQDGKHDDRTKILAWYDNQLCTAKVEGINTKIKVMKKCVWIQG